MARSCSSKKLNPCATEFLRARPTRLLEIVGERGFEREQEIVAASRAEKSREPQHLGSTWLGTVSSSLMRKSAERCARGRSPWGSRGEPVEDLGQRNPLGSCFKFDRIFGEEVPHLRLVCGGMEKKTSHVY
uniref:Uncharacterized protein n=1 Tax=Zea mays TaxID=4577 RepID=A0A804QKL4_MAIZE